MTKKERQKIKKAIDYFLDDSPDKWVDGINELFLLIYGIKWTSMVGLDKTKSCNIAELIESANKPH